jgi:hypothetical protein
MNGLYKNMYLKAKLDVIRAKPPDKRQFVPEDIILLVTEAFEKSFTCKDLAKKAIANHGWIPATFALLDHPLVSKGKNGDSLMINVNNGLASTLLDKVIRHEKLEEGCKKNIGDTGS